MNKSEQNCTIFKTSFLSASARAGGLPAACTKCTKRGMFDAQARRGYKRALRGREGAGVSFADRRLSPDQRSGNARSGGRVRSRTRPLAASGDVRSGIGIVVVLSEVMVLQTLPHRRKWRCVPVLLRGFEQGVRVEADHLFAQPVVNVLHSLHHRR